MYPHTHKHLIKLFIVGVCVLLVRIYNNHVPHRHIHENFPADLIEKNKNKRKTLHVFENEKNIFSKW